MPLSSQFSMADEDNVNEEITGAPHQIPSSTIPAGLITRAELRLHPHINSYENEQTWHTSPKGLVYLYGLFTILQGLYVGHTPERSEHQGEATANSDHEHQGCEEVKDDTVAVSSS